MNADVEKTPEVRLDFERPGRKGISEVIYCPGKSDAQLLSIARGVRQRGVTMAFSRMTAEQAALVAGDPPLEHDPVSRLGVIKFKDAQPGGLVAVLSAGSSDVPIASEAAAIAELNGCRVKKFFDVGVAGLHRLLSILPEIKDAPVVIVAAGMDGALPSVVAGLVRGLVIGLPTSVGYGIASGGNVALGSMLSSCSPGLVVVNIDNGVGAGLSAVIAARREITHEIT
ncbi:MAG: nickel pincer cofactor biosynthesis protein LarB [Synergistaceae bacterium]|jgi:NCAIR mutase (PurE)-related protein|nr:nickel pincer cofactor biosynthesis protein LarB [Synergistaceae bacterium]